jgi:gamma-glutamyltranspeptidase/glutathione hydrolase
VSYAGVLHLTYYEAKSGKLYALDCGWNSYRRETDPGTIPVTDLRRLFNDGRQPTHAAEGGKTTEGRNPAEGRKTLVPGFMAGIEAMHRRFGRLPFAHLFQPAIWYAEHGVTLSQPMSAMLRSEAKSLTRTPEGQQFLHQAGDYSAKTGDRFVQADLAKTLRGVARQGARYMYTGPWGKQFVAAVQREGGKVTIEDMKGYRPAWEEPLSTTFGGATIAVPGKHSEGGHQVLEALNLIEELRLDQRALYWKDPNVFRELSEVLQFVETGPRPTLQAAEYQRKNGLAFSPDDRITKEYARAMAPLLRQLRMPESAPQATPHSAGTVVIDRWGNVAAAVHSIEDLPWGSTGIVVGGIPLSGVGGVHPVLLAAIKPGDRLPTPAAPVIAMVGGKPALALAGVGTSLIPETVRIVLGILGNHVECREIVAAPPLLYNTETPQPEETYAGRRQLVPEGAYGAQFLADLEAAGVRLKLTPKPVLLSLRERQLWPRLRHEPAFAAASRIQRL